MVSIDLEKCVTCGGCLDLCPSTAMRMFDDKVEIDPDECVGCKICMQACPLGAPVMDAA